MRRMKSQRLREGDWTLVPPRAGLPLYKMLGGSAREIPIERYYWES